MEKHYLLGEVAKVLNRRPHQITYLLANGTVPEPKLRIANKRLFLEEDVKRLARHLRVTPDWTAIERSDRDSEPSPPESLTLKSPFDVTQMGQSGCEVRDADGVVMCWTCDRARALVLAGLLEAAVQA